FYERGDVLTVSVHGDPTTEYPFFLGYADESGRGAGVGANLNLPLAAGAAVACPDRKVITLQADGSGMYTLQALWTQARENLDCLTVILANRSYATLH
ncbi:thiamine pyrophosphate-dependent enzyme, partial [Burkholderia sp. SIMBA_019]|uniref:thiamine pyrophosphate-dependent enzyme n=1 Tax=Burkholderia sp. SIMBA_019 TaxID=3085765 RepID=UPI0039789910